MEKINEVTQIMSILIVLSVEIMHLTFVSFFFEFHLGWFK